MLAQRIDVEARGLPSGAAVAVLVNRAARATRGPGWEGAVEKIIARRLAPELFHPDGPEEMTAVARDCARTGAAAIIVAGGDGSVNRVAAAIAGLGVPLGLIPLGTANDLARELGIPRRAIGAARRVVDGSVRALDLLEVNGRPFCTVGGLGVAADAALSVNRLRRSTTLGRALHALGTRVYPLAAAASILLRPQVGRRIRVTYSDPHGRPHVVEGDAHALLVANQRSLAGGLTLPTASANDDGVFELCVVRAGSRLGLLAALLRLASGREPAAGVVAVHRAVRAHVECDRTAPFFGDGEELAHECRFDLRLRRRMLPVVC